MNSTRDFRRPGRACFLAALAFAACAPSWAAPQFAYQGPDEFVIVGRPNAAGSNVRRAELHSRELPAGHLETLLAPLVTAAVQGCSMDDVRRIAIAPAPLPDRIGDTSTRINGIGLYLNLPLADHVFIGNFYLAPFLAVTVSLAGEAGPLQSFTIFEFSKVVTDRPDITQSSFLEARTPDLEAAIASFAKARLGPAMRKALGARCA